jgi:RNA polymerase sigma factor (sigma-70 family)
MVLPCDDMADFDLIRRMADQKSDFAAAKEAWGYFYLCHHRVLSCICMSDHGYLLGPEGVKDVVQDTFLKAFDRAESFNYQESCEADIQEKKCRAWLARIAENIVRDRFRGQPEICIVEETEIDQIELPRREDADETQISQSDRLKLLESGFALLSEVEQTVLRATMFWWHPDQQHQRMPNAAMLQLSQQIGKSPDNIRKIRSRAVNKLEKYVNENVDDEKAG